MYRIARASNNMSMTPKRSRENNKVAKYASYIQLIILSTLGKICPLYCFIYTVYDWRHATHFPKKVSVLLITCYTETWFCPLCFVWDIFRLELFRIFKFSTIFSSLLPSIVKRILNFVVPSFLFFIQIASVLFVICRRSR